MAAWAKSLGNTRRNISAAKTAAINCGIENLSWNEMSILCSTIFSLPLTQGISGCLAPVMA
ncbi:hypothetical protein K5D44_12215 [Pseudomonas cichorii]|nr:hypothetical protein [Pseudomonas cichorii]MBX8539768.1 hypothetical protein [Pseudomonas cichorii]MBX8559682.1 hypothetical protein [Pseudomonas cichorii]MBX8565457.1 hypothetical protein [Pseudomonas cichorii]MBX8569314.1 hypothetical protein [Pseudomonas cichorii]MBX8579857.1 hypothetical protein [Pseudomonas cichorii]